MIRSVIALGILGLVAAGPAYAQKTEKPALKPLPPMVAEIIKLTPAEFIKRFDKNTDGTLSKEELPPFLARNFEKADRDANGKLDLDEVSTVLQNMRAFFAQKGQAPVGAEVDRFVDKVLADQDANKDGKIARSEAKARVAEVFDRLDTNGDGFIDRAELRVIAQRVLAMGGGGPRPAEAKQAGPDFDSFDKNADGRLSREELRGTPYLARFAEIDTDNSGLIDRREFENFLSRAAKK